MEAVEKTSKYSDVTEGKKKSNEIDENKREYI